MTLSGRYPYHKLSSISSAQLAARARKYQGDWEPEALETYIKGRVYMQKERHTVQYEHGHKLKNIGNCIHPCFSRILMV